MLSEQLPCSRPGLHQCCNGGADPSWDAACSSMWPYAVSWSTTGRPSLQLSGLSKLHPSGSWGTWTGMLKDAWRQPGALKGDLLLQPDEIQHTVSALWGMERQGGWGWALCRTEHQPLTEQSLNGAAHARPSFRDSWQDCKGIHLKQGILHLAPTAALAGPHLVLAATQ